MGPASPGLGSDSSWTGPFLPASLLPSFDKYFLSTCCMLTLASAPGPGDGQIDLVPALKSFDSIDTEYSMTKGTHRSPQLC